MSEFYTQNGWKGSSYQPGLSTKEIAAKIRKQVRAEFKGQKISVTYQSYSGGSSVSITIMALDFDPLNPDYDADSFGAKVSRGHPDHVSRYSDRYNKMIEDLTEIASQYRRDDSDGMIDYFCTNFYLHVDMDWRLRSELVA